MYEHVLERIKVGEVTAKIYSDNDATNPREDGDDQELCPMVCFHSRYTLGDKHNYADPDAFMMALAREASPKHDDLENKLDTCLYNRMVPLAFTARADQRKEVERQLKAFHAKRREIIQKILDKHYIILPLGLYDHSGITMYVGSGPHFCDSGGWDSGQVGWIYCKVERAKEEWGQQHYENDGPNDYVRRAKEYLKASVNEYDQFLRGDVYRYVVEDEHGEHLDSCHGLFGWDCARDEATGQAKAEWQAIEQERAEAAEIEEHAQQWYQRMMAL